MPLVRGLEISNEKIRWLAARAVTSMFAGDYTSTIQVLKPLLDAKVPFRKLDLLGKEIGKAGRERPEEFFKGCDKIIDYNAMGGFVVVGQALICLLEKHFERVMEKSREYITKVYKWYVCDIIGERCLGQALIDYFDRTLPWLIRFLCDDNRWVRRSAGVMIHFFSKRVLDEPGKTGKLLDLVEPNIEERQIDAAKGIGWGLKTIGKHHPDILVQFLREQVKARKCVSRFIMKKAVTYLDREKRKKVEGYVQNLQNEDHSQHPQTLRRRMVLG